MTIISVKQQITKFFIPSNLDAQAKSTGFMKRIRAIKPLALVTSLVAALSKSNVTSINEIVRQFNGMRLSEDEFVAYKPFHNQLAKEAFPTFIKQITQQAMATLLPEEQALPKRLKQFKQVILHDGSSLTVHPELASEFKGRFTKTAPAAVECHVSLSLFERKITRMNIAADSISEHDYLPAAQTLKSCLFLADSGYVNTPYFAELDANNANYIVKGKSNLNPIIIKAYNGRGKALKRPVGKKLKEITQKQNGQKMMDFDVAWGKYQCRLLRCWVASEQKFVIWLTNLPRSTFSADDVTMLYRVRWQVELLFKELKSYNNLRKFNTKKKPIVEGLTWASLLTLIIKRAISTKAVEQVSFFKAAMNTDVWLIPLLQALADREYLALQEKLEWAYIYLRNNASLSQQKKSNLNSSLHDIYEYFNS
ncbi:IS4 family transposase [uncultured Shewanella sp.]|uniref:IS4 family transposase n=1 Tax=uncultured Shewanella sp. TaxID=173975 RepID=UPI002604C9F6|nr:IS4 family transposase [uncultured Shewanella sp.]